MSPRPRYLGRSMRTALALCLSWWLVACGDLGVRSVRTPPITPTTLAGEWVGSWQASSQTTSGAITVRVQEFEGEPVVRVAFVNPCITPAEYELVTTATTIELRDGATVVLAASVTDDRTMVGTYNCPNETGTWSAAWTRELPQVVDLGGRWSGTLGAASQPARPFELTLEQSVGGGQVLLQGVLDLGELWPFSVPLRGSVVFQDQGFDFVLQTLGSAQPDLLLAGSGSRAPLQVPTGLLQVFGATPLPFQTAVVTLAWQAPN
jgi:hypothetical protein